MNLSNIKKIVLEEGRVVIIDGEDAMVVMSLNEYEKIKSKNLGMASALLEAKPVSQSEIISDLPKVEAQETKVIKADIPQQEVKAETESPSEIKSELTLDDLPF